MMKASLWLGLTAQLMSTVTAAGFTAVTPQGADYLDVGGSSWSVTNANGSIKIPATVPGYIHLDLFEAGIIPDPMYGNNFNFTTWIADDEWTYTRQLPSKSPDGKAWSAFQKVYMLFEGLDTVAHVSINKQPVGFGNNQFRQWIFDATDAVKNSGTSGNLTLEVAFESPVKYMLEVFESTGSPYTVFTNYFWTYPEGREYIRKDQSSFGWDWGPHFAPTGIYRPAYLIGLDSGSYVTNTFIDIYKNGQRPNMVPDQDAPWVVNVSVDYLAANAGFQPALTVSVAGQTVTAKNVTATVAGQNTAEVLFNVTEGSVQRWWPAEFGTPHLYNATIKLDMGINETPSSAAISNGSSNALSYVKRVGFRTIVLNLKPYTDRFGSNFHFEVNGHIFNTKGSNMVPMDPFESRVDYQWYKRLMQSAIASNFNMIRLWASGNYYSDDLYDIADELGIFLWSEFQFGDNFYPVFPEFLENVREEALFQVRRLNRHPCLSVWTGGNELEGYNIGKLTWNETYGESWFKNWTILAGETLWPLVYSNTRSLSWLQASDSHGYSFYNPNTGVWINRYGEMSSNYAYASESWGPGETYNLAIDQAFNHSLLLSSRFMVEFGIWSYDSLESYQTVLPDDEIYESAPIVVQRCFDTPNPPMQLGDAIKSYYITPNRTDNLTQFSQWAYTSQIFHAEHSKNQIESFRRGISLPENNLGQLFWQLNAPWPTLSLNSIEYTGRWKVLQHVASQAFERVALSSWLQPSNTTWNMWVTSDLWEPVTGTVTATWMTWSGEKLTTKTYDFALDALDSKELDKRQGWEEILPAGGNTKDDILILKLKASTKRGETYTHENFFVPKHISNSTIVNPGLKLERAGDLTWTVTSTTGVAAYVWITAPIGVNGYFDQNAIFMVKGESRDFTFTVLEDKTNGTWAKAVKVVSLWDNYEVPTGE